MGVSSGDGQDHSDHDEQQLAEANNGTVDVADHDDNQVLEQDADSDQPKTMPHFNGDVGSPSGVAVGKSGKFYVTDYGNVGGRVLMLPPLPGL